MVRRVIISVCAIYCYWSITHGSRDSVNYLAVLSGAGTQCHKWFVSGQRRTETSCGSRTGLPWSPRKQGPSPVVVDDNKGKDPDSVGAGHMPQAPGDLHLASFWEFWAHGPLGQLPGSDVCRDAGIRPVIWGPWWVCCRKAKLAKRGTDSWTFFCNPLSPSYGRRKESCLGP